MLMIILNKIRKTIKNLIIKSIKYYQVYVSPRYGRKCRFTPSCSEYTIQAIDKYGIIVGSIKAIIRIVKCNPLVKGGYDPLK